MNAKKHPMLHLGKWVLFRGYFSRVPEASLEALALDPVPDFAGASSEVREAHITDSRETSWRVVVGPSAKSVLLYRTSPEGEETLVRAVDCSPFVLFQRNKVTHIRLLEGDCVWVLSREFQLLLALRDPDRMSVKLATFPLKLF